MKTSTHIEAEAADWVAARDGEHWTPERQAALDAWVRESTVNRVAFLRLDAAWHRADRLRALKSPSGASRPTRRPWFMPGQPRFVLATAASMAGVVLAGVMVLGGHLGWNGFAGADVVARKDYATEVGARTSVALPDGSRMTLNTGTRLQTAMGGHERRVWLDQGEAFFEVAPDPAHPFVVLAGQQRVTVLGTKFALRRDGERLQVTVVEGKVRVQTQGSAEKVLVRDEAAVADERSLLVSRRTPDQTAAAVSWLRGRLVFDDTTLADAAEQFNRYSQRKIRIRDAAAAHIRIGGTFDADNIDGFARLIHEGFGLDVRSQDGEIAISTPS